MDPETEKPATVFVSYAHADEKRAHALIETLQRAGFDVWWDGLLQGGETYLPSIEAALESAGAVLVLWSKASVDSDWVRDEATRGRERRCLVPLSIDGTEPPLGFRQYQVIDLAKWRGKADAPDFARVVRAIEGIAGKSAPTQPVGRSLRLSRRAAIAGGAALAGGGAFALWQGGWFGGEAAPANSVAVLPFRNLSGDGAQDYFAEGISEQIRSTLSRNSRLLVLAPTSIAAVAKDSLVDDKQVARRLDVAFLLGGSVRRSGDTLRISARLTDGRTGTSAWDEQFDRKLDDVFAVQDEIADAVAGALAAQTAGTGKALSGLGGTRSVKAYDAFLRGNAFYELRTGEAAYRSALAQYDAALQADPGFAAAHAARARLIVVLTNNYAKASEFKAAYDDAEAAAREAVAIAPGLAIAQLTLGYVLVQGKLDLKGAQEPYEKARQLGSGDASVLNLYAAFAAEMGRKEQAAQASARAMELDPINPGVYRIAAFVAYCARDFARAIGHCQKALSLNPRLEQAHAYLGDSLYQMGKVAEARAEYLLEPGDLLRLTGLAIAEAKLGNTDAASAAQSRLIATMGDGATYQQAQILCQWGKLDAALERLTHAREIGDVGLALAGTDPLLDPLRARPEFSRLLSALGFG